MSKVVFCLSFKKNDRTSTGLHTFFKAPHRLIMVMHMSKLDEFKAFAHERPFLRDMVKSGKMSWQELYERYDIYGPDDEVFQEKKTVKEEKEEKSETETKEKKEGLDSILDAISGFDVDKISDGLNGMKKILNVLSEVTRPEDTPPLSRRKMSRPYQRNDD